MTWQRKTLAGLKIVLKEYSLTFPHQTEVSIKWVSRSSDSGPLFNMFINDLYDEGEEMLIKFAGDKIGYDN